MLFESLIGLCTWLIGLIFDGVSIVPLPLELLAPLFEIIEFGVWVIGADMFHLAMASVVFWLSFKLVGGVIVWVWGLLPFT